MIICTSPVSKAATQAQAEARMAKAPEAVAEEIEVVALHTTMEVVPVTSVTSTLKVSISLCGVVPTTTTMRVEADPK